MNSDAENNRELPSSKKKSYKKKTDKSWSNDATLKLIGAVEQHRCLFDAGEHEYMLSKVDAWHEVSNAVQEHGDYSSDDCKTKWNNLRIVFKRNINKLGTKKSGSGISDVGSVHWRYFQPMLFIEAAELQQATESASTLDLPKGMEDVDRSVDESVASQMAIPSPAPSTSLFRSTATAGPQKRKITNAEPTEKEIAKGKKNEAVLEALNTLTKLKKESTAKDQFSAFGELAAIQMRQLPDRQGNTVLRKMNQYLLQCLDEALLEQCLS